MVESLYSSVINAIDSRRMQDTRTPGQEDPGNRTRKRKLDITGQTE